MILNRNMVEDFILKILNISPEFLGYCRFCERKDCKRLMYRKMKLFEELKTFHFVEEINKNDVAG